MRELDPKNPLPYVGAAVVDVVAANLDAELIRGPTALSGSFEIVTAVEQDRTDLASTELVWLVRTRLEKHPHFRGRGSLFTIELVGETIVMTGCFPSFYLKQLLQEAIMAMPDVMNIDNQVQVVWPEIIIRLDADGSPASRAAASSGR